MDLVPRLRGFVGLSNDFYDMNCFLNSAIQALYQMHNFQIDIKQFPCSRLGPEHSCIACILDRLFTNYSQELSGSRKTIFAIELRQEIAKIYKNEKFSVYEKADSMEALNAILVGVHNSFHGVYNSNYMHQSYNCQCPVHLNLSLEFIENYSCGCGASEERFFSSLYQAYITDKYNGTYEELSESINSEMPYCIRHLENFINYLNEQFREVPHKQCDCGQRYKVTRAMERLPEYLIIQVIWTEDVLSYFKILQFFISLKFYMNIKDIYPEAGDSMYSVIGFIVSVPGHYLYVGRDSNTWMLVNDEKIQTIGYWENLLKIIFTIKGKVVGLFYEKSSTPYEELISLEHIKHYERKVIEIYKCFFCKNVAQSSACEVCGYELYNFHERWQCKTCESFNEASTAICYRCASRRYPYKNSKCYLCATVCEPITCLEHSKECIKCSKVLYIFQQKYCYTCGLILSDNNYCRKCRKRCKNDYICYDCADFFWTCGKCENRVLNSSSCNRCGTPKNSEFWFCKKCMVLSILNTPCKECNTIIPPEYCYECGDEKTGEHCRCSYSFTCAVCKCAKDFTESKRCWKDGGYITNDECESCKILIPRDWIICAKCFPTVPKEIEEFLSTFEKKTRNSKKTKKQCIECGKDNKNIYTFCWMCSNKFKTKDDYCINCKVCPPNLCLDCLTVSYRCKYCKCTILGISCQRCTFIEFPELIETGETNRQSSEDDWNCIACNYWNSNQILFCEKCNQSKEFSFTSLYLCFYCGDKSYDKICKKCFWYNFCSLCEKKMYATQKQHCGHCGGILVNRKCKKCDVFVSKERILCRGCSFKIDVCPCGNKKYPKSKKCKHCRLKVEYEPIDCYFCDEVSILDICYFCTYECGEEMCSNCYLDNGHSGIYYCRYCRCTGLKCRNCKQRRWEKCCKNKKFNMLL